MKALKLLSTVFLLNVMISVQPVNAEEIEEEVSPSEEVVEVTTKARAVDEGAGENVPPEESNDSEEGDVEAPKEEETPNENNESDVDTPPQGAGSGGSNSTEEIDEQLKESDEQVLDAVREEQKPSDNNNYNPNNSTQPEFDNNAGEVIEDEVAVSKDNSSKDEKTNKKEGKKKTPHGAKELPNTGIHENIELLYVLEIVSLTIGLLLLFRKSSKVKIRK